MPIDPIVHASTIAWGADRQAKEALAAVEVVRRTIAVAVGERDFHIARAEKAEARVRELELKLRGATPDQFKASEAIAEAVQFAAQAHAGQVDKAGVAYIFHVLRVMEAVRVDLPDDVEAQQAAVLHDVVEDTSATVALFSPRVQRLVRLLTRVGPKTRESYLVYIGTIVEDGDIAAAIIKRADLKDNLGRMTPTLERLRPLYEEALSVVDESLKVRAQHGQK